MSIVPMVPNVPWQLDRKLARDVPGAQAEQLSLGAPSCRTRRSGLCSSTCRSAPRGVERLAVLGRSPEMDLVTLSAARCERHRVALGTVARLGLPQIRGNHHGIGNVSVARASMPWRRLPEGASSSLPCVIG